MSSWIQNRKTEIIEAIMFVLAIFAFAMIAFMFGGDKKCGYTNWDARADCIELVNENS
jgi:hypothetical protein